MKLKLLLLSFFFAVTGWAVTSPPLILGSGSPESVITAPIGSVFRRLDGGAGTTFYLKESGTSNTGWKAALTASQVAIVTGKLLTVNNTITLAGTDGTTMTFPATSATLARTDAANTFTGHQTIEGVTSTGATGTGNFVFSIGPTFTGTTTLAAMNISGTAAFTGLVNQTLTSNAANPNIFAIVPTLTNPNASFGVALAVAPVATAANAGAAVVGMQIGASFTAGSTAASGYAIYINPSNVSTSTVANNYGILINAIQGAVTGNYAIYTNAGLLRFGDTTEATIAGAGAVITLGGFHATKKILSASSIQSYSATAGIGYTTGAGGTVTQGTDRVTGVTVSKVTGTITTHTASLAALASASFTVTNTAVAISDTVVVSIRSGQTNKKTIVSVTAVAAGSFEVTVYNADASTAETGAIIINFTVIKGVTS